jgi:hypothetical protein
MAGTAPDNSRRAGTALRIAGAVILLFGLGGAGLDYWMSAPLADISDDVLTSSNSKKVQRAIEVNVGKMGVVMGGLSEDLQDPATQAIVIALASILVSGGCFYVARLQARAAQPGDPP